jgi:hypothetical protein
MVECAWAISILGMLVGAGAYVSHHVGQFNRHELARRRCLAAAEAQIDSIAETGKPLPAAEVKRLWPKVKFIADRRPARGAWEGTLRHEVKAEWTHKPSVSVTLVRFVAAQKGDTP